MLFAYFFTGILASLTSCLFHADIPSVAVGASGAIFGLFGVLLALLTTRFFLQEDRDALIKSLGITIGMNVFYSFRAGVDFAAHFGGLASGLLIGYCLYLTFIFPKKSLNLGVYFSIALLTLGGSSISIQHLKAKNSFVFYELKEEIGLQHEEIVELLLVLEKKPNKEVLTQLEEVIIPKSEKIKTLLKQMDPLRLTQQQVKFQQFLGELYSLQIENFNLIAKSIKEDTSLYESRIEELGRRCDDLVKQFQENRESREVS